MPRLLDTLLRRHRSYKAVFRPAVVEGDAVSMGRKMAADFVLGDLLERCNMGRPSFAKDAPHLTAYNEGRRSVILYVLNVLGEDPMETYQRMERAQKETEYGD